MMTKKHLTLLASTVLVMLSATARAEAPAAPTPEHSVTGNLTLASDYRFRGVSQTWKLPTVQGGLDYAHKSGVYLGTWLSNVSGNSYNNGAGLEMDLYGGYKWGVADGVTLDLGALAYVYPGASLNSAPGVSSGQRYTNGELYLGVTAGAFSGKLSYAVTDYFGLNSTTAGYAYFSALKPNGGSKGTVYLDLNYTVDLGDGWSLATHLGHTAVAKYGDLSYTDVKVALAKEWMGLTWTGALVGTDAKKDLYQIANSQGTGAKTVAGTSVVLSVGKTF